MFNFHLVIKKKLTTATIKVHNKILIVFFQKCRCTDLMEKEAMPSPHISALKDDALMGTLPLLGDFMPAVMQALHYYTDMMMYEQLHTTTIEPPLGSNNVQADEKPTTTWKPFMTQKPTPTRRTTQRPTTTTRRTTTTTTPRPTTTRRTTTRRTTTRRSTTKRTTTTKPPRWTSTSPNYQYSTEINIWRKE